MFAILALTACFAQALSLDTHRFLDSAALHPGYPSMPFEHAEENAAALWAFVKAQDAQEKLDCMGQPCSQKLEDEEAFTKHLRLAADFEDRVSHEENNEALEESEDSEALGKVSASAEKDAQQIKDVAALEKKDAMDTEKSATRLRQDADAIDAVTGLEKAKADVKQMWKVADLEDREAQQEGAKARMEKEDAKAIKAVASKAKNNAELEDAKKIEDIADEEEKDAADTKKEAASVRKDAESIVSSIIPGVSKVTDVIKGWIGWTL